MVFCLCREVADITGVHPAFVLAVSVSETILAPSINAPADIRSTLFATLKFHNGIFVKVFGMDVWPTVRDNRPDFSK
jgi:hypothetical protein